MNSRMMFVVASLILVGAIVAIGVPYTVEAKNTYCTHNIGCFDSKKECREASLGVAGDICDKQKSK